MAINKLKEEALYQHCDVGQFSFSNTSELDDLVDILGQDRAIEAIRFGIGIKQDGYNLYVMGPHGTGKHTIISDFLTQKAASEAPPSDWCYVNNFDDPHKPLVLQLPAGQGQLLRQDMEQLVDELLTVIPAAFESDEYGNRVQEIEDEFKAIEERALTEIQNEADKDSIALIRTKRGFVFSPVRNEKILGPEEFEKLEEKERRHVESVIETLHEKLQAIIHKVPQWRRESHDKVKDLNRETVMIAIGHLFDTLRDKYDAAPNVLSYLEDVQKNVIRNSDDFSDREGITTNILGIAVTQTPSFRAYQVNVLVDNSNVNGAPVVYEDHPTYQNLVGRVEHLAMMGALVADFTQIKPGAMHLANNGYLMLDAYKLLQNPYAWDALKRLLRSRVIRIESLERMLSLVSTMSIEPEVIPLDVKVVLLGDRMLYYLLYQYDPDFGELFKVEADFEEKIDRTPENNQLYARLIGGLARKESLLPLDSGAVARVIEHSARMMGDSEKLTTHMRSVVDLLHESDYWAKETGNKLITAIDIQQAIDAKIRRADRLRKAMQESIQRGNTIIDTDQDKTGQINALSVVQLGDFSFGIPTRITATTRLGEGELVDIEREVELGGPIHSKGVLILAGYLGSRYAGDIPLSLSASLVFEQSYGEVEGDSASSAELYALLSSLAGVPVSQALAVTGSVNQHGQVQAIGAVNEKVEGFYDICKERGLNGQQGVIIPAANVKHLMLRQDVVEASAKGEFSIYPVETINQGIELLTGRPAGELDVDGKYPQDSINFLVKKRLEDMSTLRQQFSERSKANS